MQASAGPRPGRRGGGLGRDRRPVRRGRRAGWPVAGRVGAGQPDVGRAGAAVARRAARRRAAPGVRRCSRELRMRKSRRRGRRAAPGRCRRSTGCTPGWPSSCGPGAPSARSGREIAAAILAEGHATVDFVIVGSGPNGASPAPRGRRPGARGRRPGRGRHRRHHGRGLLLGLHPHVRPRRAAGGVPRLLRGAARRPSWPPARTSGPASPPSRSTPPPATSSPRPATASIHPPHRARHRRRDATRSPTSSRATPTVLEPGMAFSIEPGIYLPGRHGARIEDIVVCHRRTASSGSTSPTASSSSWRLA